MAKCYFLWLPPPPSPTSKPSSASTAVEATDQRPVRQSATLVLRLFSSHTTLKHFELVTEHEICEWQYQLDFELEEGESMAAVSPQASLATRQDLLRQESPIGPRPFLLSAALPHQGRSWLPFTTYLCHGFCPFV